MAYEERHRRSYQMHKSCDFDFHYDRLYDISNYLIIDLLYFQIVEIFTLCGIIKNDNDICESILQSIT